MVSVEVSPLARRVFENEVAMVGALHKAGVRVIAGTDQAIPGHSLHRELELCVRAGFSPLEAIQAATTVPAQVMGLEREVGTIEVNKRADLILPDANPLVDIHNIRSVTSWLPTECSIRQQSSGRASALRRRRRLETRANG